MPNGCVMSWVSCGTALNNKSLIWSINQVTFLASSCNADTIYSLYYCYITMPLDQACSVFRAMSMFNNVFFNIGIRQREVLRGPLRKDDLTAFSTMWLMFFTAFVDMWLIFYAVFDKIG